MAEQEDFLSEREEDAQRQAAARAAVSQAMDQTREVQNNPQFLQQLRDPDIDSPLVPIADELGAETSGSHVIGNRDDDYPRRLELFNQNAADRFIAERDPRPVYREKPHLLEIAQDAHKRETARVRKPLTSEEQRHVRSGFDALTSFQGLAAENRGLSSVTEATAVTKTEGEEETRAGRAASFFE